MFTIILVQLTTDDRQGFVVDIAEYLLKEGSNKDDKSELRIRILLINIALLINYKHNKHSKVFWLPSKQGGLGFLGQWLGGNHKNYIRGITYEAACLLNCIGKPFLM